MPINDSHTFFWLVGLLEGEGYFAYSPNRRTAIIEVEMKDEHVIARIAALFGLSYRRRDRRARNPNASVTYSVKLSGRRAMQLMKRVQPYLSPRRQRAVQLAEDRYLEAHPGTGAYEKVPLPPLVEVPYTVVRDEYEAQ